MEKKITEIIESKKSEFIGLSQEIHANPELGNEEFFASTLLKGYLKKNGFEITSGIGGHETGFVAKKKSHKQSGEKIPTIAFLAEYDALPGLGHACGHNIIGAISVAGGVALGEILNEVPGEVLILGCPSEEGGKNGGAKASYVKENLFQDVDLAMMIHPGNENCVTGKTLALATVDFEFFGQVAHASGSPEKGKNALDAVIHLFNGISTLRQHVTPDVKMHGIITHGGEAPNIIPDYTKAKFYLRAGTKEGVDKLIEQTEKIAQGAGLITGCQVKTGIPENRLDNMVPTEYFDSLYAETLEKLGYQVKPFTRKSIGSTDAGNVSHVIPTIHPTIKICDSTVPAHTHEFASASSSSKGDEAVILGGKALALLGLKLLQNPGEIEKIKEAHLKSKAESLKQF